MSGKESSNATSKPADFICIVVSPAYGYFSPHLETQPIILFIQDDTPATIVKMYCSRGVTLKKISIIKKLLPCSRGGVKDTRLEGMAKDRLSEDRSSQGHGQESSRPRSRTKDTVCKCSQKRKKKVFTQQNSQIFCTISVSVQSNINK